MVLDSVRTCAVLYFVCRTENAPAEDMMAIIRRASIDSGMMNLKS